MSSRAQTLNKPRRLRAGVHPSRWSQAPQLSLPFRFDALLQKQLRIKFRIAEIPSAQRAFNALPRADAQ
jgi:hypothetical protein